MPNQNSFDLKPVLFSLFLMLGIFAIDLSLPLGVAAGVPYIAVIFISLWMHNNKVVVSFAVACSLLVVLGFFLSPEGGTFWVVIANRSLTILAIWATALLGMLQENTRLKIIAVELEREKDKEKIYLATLHGAQHVINNLLNQLLYVQMEVEKHPDFNKVTAKLFNDMLIEAQTLIVKLSSVQNMDPDEISKSVH